MKNRILVLLVVFVLGISTAGCRLPLADDNKCDVVEAMLNELLTASKEGDYEKASEFFVNPEDLKETSTEISLEKLIEQCRKTYGDSAVQFIESYEEVCKEIMQTSNIEVVYVNKDNQAVVEWESVDETDLVIKLVEKLEGILTTYGYSEYSAVFNSLNSELSALKDTVDYNNIGVRVIPVKVKEVDGEYKIAEMNPKLEELIQSYGLGQKELIMKEFMGI